MRKRALAPVLALLLTATLGSSAAGPEPPECVEAARWVRAHPGALPTTLAELSTFSLAYRRAIYEALPDQARTALWREHMEGFLHPGGELSDVQRAALREVIVQLPAFTRRNADRALVKAVEQRVAGTFDKDLRVRVFATLGEAGAAKAAAKARPLCDCAFDDEWDRCGSDEACSPNLCSYAETGCGFGWMYGCYGVCR